MGVGIVVELIVLPLACFAVLTLFGVALISPLRSGHRQVLLAASPVIGAAFLAVVLATTTWFVTAGPGIVVAVVIAMAVVSVALARRRASFRFGGSAWSFAAVTWGIGVVGAVLALGPNIAIGDSRVVMANGNHDAYYASHGPQSDPAPASAHRNPTEAGRRRRQAGRRAVADRRR